MALDSDAALVMVSREEWPPETIWSTQPCTNRPDLSTTKPGAWAPGICLLSRGAREGVGAQLRGRLIVRSGCLGLWGRSCRRWHLGPGVEWDVPLGPGHLRRSRERCSGRCGSPSGVARQERQRSVENVGAGAGSSACSLPVLRGAVFHLWRFRIRCAHNRTENRWRQHPGRDQRGLFISGNGAS